MTSTIKLFGKVLMGFVILFVLCIIVLLIIIKSSDPNRFKPVIISQIKEVTGADLEIYGDIEVSVIPSPRLSFNDVSYRFLTESKTDVLVTAEKAMIKTSLSAYFKEAFEVDAFSLDNALITISEKGKKPQKYQISQASGSLVNTCCGYIFPTFHILMADGSLKGNIEFQTDQARPLIKGNIKAKDINLGLLGPTDKSSLPPSTKVIPAVEMPFELFHNFDLDINIKLADVQQNDFIIEHGDLTIKSKDGKADIHPISLSMLEGKLEGNMSFTATKPNAGKVEANLNITQMSILPMVKALDAKGGRFDGHFEGRGSGSTLRGILGNWDGKALWVMGPTTLYHTELKADAADVVLGMVNFINPLHKEESDTQITCSAMRYDIKGGKAFALNNVALETNRLDVLGSGTINLKTEDIDFEFNLREKKGLNLNLGNISDFIRLTGTLQSPQVTMDPKGIVKEGLSLFSAVASGGLSLVAEQVFDTLGDNGTPCAKVVGN